MKKLIAVLLTTLSLASIQNVQADPWQGFYVEGFAGANFAQNKKHDGNKLNLRTGYAVGGALGYGFCNGFHLEGEISYRHNRIKSIQFNDETFSFGSSSSSSSSSSSFTSSDGSSGSSSGRGHGHVSTIAYMANGYYEFDTSCWDCCWGCGEIVPYFGAGIGYAHEKIKISNNFSDFETNNNNNKKKGFAWQLIAGLGYEVACNTDISIEYRFFKGHAKRFYQHFVGATAKYRF